MTSPWVDGEELTAAILYERITVPLNLATTDTGWLDPVAAGIISAVAGSISSAVIRKLGQLVVIRAVINMPAITVPADGNVSNTSIVSVDDANYQVSAGSPPQALSDGASGPISAWIINNANLIQLTAVSAGAANISAGDTWSFAGSYTVGGG